MCKFPSLTQLDLSFNQITVIPATIAQIQNLTQLALSDPQITDIPPYIETLSELTKLDLRLNRLSISPEILGPSSRPSPSETIFNYCRELRSSEKRQLNEAKILPH